jgi:uncharacterized protein
MSASLPPVVDAWRMVAARRIFEGTLALGEFHRLRSSLVDADGDCRFVLEFGRDHLDLPFVEIRAEARLPLLCQRSLERFLQPVSIRQRLGLITQEAQESALPEGVEPLLLTDGAELNPIDLIEDELILALPVVPIDPDSTLPEVDWADREEDKPNPFAALSALKEKLK